MGPLAPQPIQCTQHSAYFGFLASGSKTTCCPNPPQNKQAHALGGNFQTITDEPLRFQHQTPWSSDHLRETLSHLNPRQSDYS